MQYQADVLADSTIERILGSWQMPREYLELSVHAEPSSSPLTSATRIASQWPQQWQKLADITEVFQQWPDNHSINIWRAPSAGLAAEIGLPLEAYLRAGEQLPAWADAARIERAETLFMDYGALSVTLLFCSSLPECYVIPDLAAVLHVTGQLEKHTEHRIRSTGAMIFPVMMKGGLTDPHGGGIAQILKVRLIHATIRNLILRGSPQDALSMLGAQQNTEGAGMVPPLPGLRAADDMHQVLFAHGWKTGEVGLPCNQEELAYTLLTFGYVFLRSMRKLGLGLPPADEEAYLHAWNVAGHVLGIERELMADTMIEAEMMFSAMQSRGRAGQLPNPALTPDPRPALGQALINAISRVIPFRAFKSFPLLMTRHLCGSASAQDLGLNGPVSGLPRLLFTLFMLVTGAIDWLVRRVVSDFSIARFLTRLLGYQLMTKLLMDQVRPLKLPKHILDRVDFMMEHWSNDPKAPGWMNSIEDRMTIKGSWKTTAQK